MLEMKTLEETFRGKNVLLTGHTGFKGSWLSLWLNSLGADVTGISLPGRGTVSHFDILNLPADDRRLDIRDLDAVRHVFKERQPEIVFHAAAQPLVRQSYHDPIETWTTNVIGTANILEACRKQTSVRAIVVITSDKCYENREWLWGYREIDRLGGHDPYSASKAGSELVAASYRSAFFAGKTGPLLATARAGNVIGGGDWADDRLIPDLIRSIEKNESLEIRSPSATRPWQHVLDSLNGYLMLGQRLLMGEETFAGPWNFGPERESNCSVTEVLNKLKRQWASMRWHATQSHHPHEANFLYLDSSKAQNQLCWKPIWNLNTTLLKTAQWYQAWLENGEVITRQQLSEYASSAAMHNSSNKSKL